MVPNSLGPGELLLHYGTAEQKQHYLPRLAKGDEIPCFALTGPEAGSDAAATQSEGIVEKRMIDGKEIVGLRLNWKKRYITLAPVATLIGLAFRLKDPDKLLGDEEDLGISCALIPRATTASTSVCATIRWACRSRTARSSARTCSRRSMRSSAAPTASAKAGAC